ncbi:Nose resistant to fluoxetine protein 6-like protein, partial [Leptotrombidium deliense]
IAIAVYGLIIFLVLLGTFIEICLNFQKQSTNDEKEAKSCVTEVLLCFSVLRNTRELFLVKQKRSNLSVVHGIRVLSMIWIIVGHTYLFGTVYRMLYTFRRLQVDIPKYPGRIQYQALNNSYLCVDSFFFISGLVLVYVSLPLLKKTGGKFNYLLYIAHRWLRMTPALIGLILFIYLFPFFGSGPVFKHHVNPYVNSCERNWWYDLLFISNWYQDIPGMCAEQVWFIGADFQIYIFAPLIFLLYNRSEKKGLIVNIVVLLIGIVSSGISVYVTDSQATFTLDHYSKDDKKPNIPIVLQILMWIILPSASLYAMFSTYRWNNYLESSQPSLFTTITFAALQRSLWCIGIAWITFTCAVGRGSIVNDFLSANVFVPFSRLSFCVFLMHLSPILLRAFSVKFTRNWDDHTFVSIAHFSMQRIHFCFCFQLSWAAMNVILSTLAAFALYTLFEAPFQRLEKMVFRSNDCQRKQHSANNELRTANVECSERSTQKSSTSMRL